MDSVIKKRHSVINCYFENKQDVAVVKKKRFISKCHG